MQSRPDVVVHAAGIPDPSHDPGPVIFANNILVNYNVAEAVAWAQVPRLVYISSETALGFVTAQRPFVPDYLPVDEDHRRRPQDAYALSKALGEDICDALVARSDTSVVSIRPSFVLDVDDYGIILPFLQKVEGPSFNYWSYVDVEDLASLIVLAAAAGTPGHEVVYAAQPDNYMGRPFLELVEAAYREAGPPVRPLAREDSGGISIEKARRLFGWDPKLSWRDRLPT
jgi:nucleoside-diphosphate-sugar epimerase